MTTTRDRAALLAALAAPTTPRPPRRRPVLTVLDSIGRPGTATLLRDFPGEPVAWFTLDVDPGVGPTARTESLLLLHVTGGTPEALRAAADALDRLADRYEDLRRYADPEPAWMTEPRRQAEHVRGLIPVYAPAA